MLDKATCKQCIDRFRKNAFRLFVAGDYDHDYWEWVKVDEEHWRTGTVLCSVDEIGLISIDDDVPLDCYYLLEQLLIRDAG